MHSQNRSVEFSMFNHSMFSQTAHCILERIKRRRKKCHMFSRACAYISNSLNYTCLLSSHFSIVFAFCTHIHTEKKWFPILIKGIRASNYEQKNWPNCIFFHHYSFGYTVRFCIIIIFFGYSVSCCLCWEHICCSNFVRKPKKWKTPPTPPPHYDRAQRASEKFDFDREKYSKPFVRWVGFRWRWNFLNHPKALCHQSVVKYWHVCLSINNPFYSR